uniref:Uncharacterized protein n=1 Tax=Globodera rostochiensis TaxID=31243 RepID=A0A914HLJ1_GLORO
MCKSIKTIMPALQQPVAHLIAATIGVDTDQSISEDQQYQQQLREIIEISNIQQQLFNENQQSNRQNGTDPTDSSGLPMSEIGKDSNQPISGIGNVQPSEKHFDHHTNKIIEYEAVNQPISKETLKWLKTSLSAIDKHNANRCNQIEEIPQANELMEERMKMLDKLSNSKTITREDVSKLFDTISAYWDASVDRLAEFLKSLDAYKTDGRLMRAMEIEKDKAKNKKEIAKFDKSICSKLCKKIAEDVDESVLELIREAYQNLEIMRILATPEKQKEYVEHFQMYYYKKEDLGKQLSHAKDKAAEMPKSCAATEKAYKAAACCCTVCLDESTPSTNCCLCDCFLSVYNCVFCLPISLATLAVGCAISLPIDAVNGIRAVTNAVKQKIIRKNLQSVKKNIEDISH